MQDVGLCLLQIIRNNELIDHRSQIAISISIVAHGFNKGSNSYTC